MEDVTKVVETKTDGATTQQEEVTVKASEVDYEAVLKQKDEELAQISKEKENYKRGLLKAKGKLPDESSGDDDVENSENVMRRIVREEMLSTKEAQLQAEKDNALKAVLKRNKELEVALKNRGQITVTSAGGSNEDKPEVKTDTYFSQEQIRSLKAKGWSDEKIATAKKNMIKDSEMPKV